MWTEIWFVALVFGGACFATLALNTIFAPRSDAVAMTVLLTWLCSIELAMLSVPSPPENSTSLVLLDTIGALAVLACWRAKRATWKLAMFWLFVASIGVEAAKWSMITWAPDINSPETRNLFRAARNVMFFAQLVCAGWTGGVRVAGRLGHLLHHPPPAGSRVGIR